MEKYFYNWNICKEYIRVDTFRYIGDWGNLLLREIIKTYIRRPEYRYIFWMRLYQFCIGRRHFFPLKMLCVLILKILRNKTGIQISPYTMIGKGFYIGHFGSIVINPSAIIGDCCNIIQTCTIGLAYRGKNEGVPIIGDRVYIGPGARLIGGVVIGNDVAIGANAVVTHSAINNSVVAGVPAKIISYNGSEGYIYNYVDQSGVFHPRFEYKMKESNIKI